MSISVKICGITTREAADAALRAGAEFAGLVFYPKSPRRVSLEQAQTLAGMLRGRTRIVALLVSPDDYDIETVVRAVKPNLLQLHGHENHARVVSIGEKFGLPLIKAVGVAEAEDVVQGQKFEDAADYLMFDTKGRGGEGVAFDWTILSGRTFRRPWFLAGGLNADNVGHAIQISGASMVDVSSGVEDAPGVKNPDKIAAFVAAARNARHADSES